MPYIGNQPGTGVRSRFIYTATASQTTFTGADDNSKTLKYADSAYVDVFLNGVCLVPGTDYTASTKTSIVLTQAASLSDTLEVIAYDIASMSDMSASNGGTFQADVTFADGADIITASKGTDNVRLGENAGAAIASGGNQNVAIGKDAGTALTTGDSNTFIGAKVGDAITTSSGNVAIGGDATYAALGSDTQGKFTTAVGVGALRAQNFTSDTASNNVAVGYFAGGVMDDGTANTFVGSLAGDDCVNGNNNTAVGKGSLSADAGDNNTAVGLEALRDTTGSINTAIGKNSGNAITSGTKNTIIGSYTGNQNGLDIRTSSNNIVLSDGDGRPLGYRSGSDGTWYFDNAAGSQSAITARNTGTGGFPYGININYPNAAPNNDSGRFFTCSDSSAIRLKIFNNGNVVNQNNSYGVDSDIKLKENIVDAPSQWDDIKAVTVRKYSLKSDNLDEPNMLGVVAQELETAGMNGLVNETADIDKDLNDLGTTTKSVKTSILYMKAVKALQEAMTRIETLEAQNTTQATQIADLITRVTALEAE